MVKSIEVQTIKMLMQILGRNEKMKLLKNSNLTNRERKIMTQRFIVGLTAKETSEMMNMDIDTFNQAQKKIYLKMYAWLSLQFNRFTEKQQ